MCTARIFSHPTYVPDNQECCPHNCTSASISHRVSECVLYVLLHVHHTHILAPSYIPENQECYPHTSAPLPRFPIGCQSVPYILLHVYHTHSRTLYTYHKIKNNIRKKLHLRLDFQYGVRMCSVYSITCALQNICPVHTYQRIKNMIQTQLRLRLDFQ